MKLMFPTTHSLHISFLFYTGVEDTTANFQINLLVFTLWFLIPNFLAPVRTITEMILFQCHSAQELCTFLHSAIYICPSCQGVSEEHGQCTGRQTCRVTLNGHELLGTDRASLCAPSHCCCLAEKLRGSLLVAAAAAGHHRGTLHLAHLSPPPRVSI